MLLYHAAGRRARSPSTRRAWIEINVATGIYPYWTVALHPEGVDRNLRNTDAARMWLLSPSTRRAWIEINYLYDLGQYPLYVALHPEGVDRNPDHPFKVRDDEESPSTRRAWVERKS